MYRKTSLKTELKTDEYSSKWLAIILLMAIPLLGVLVAGAVNQIGLLALLAIIGLIVLLATLTNPDIGLFMFIFMIYINLSSVLITNYGFPSTARAIVVLMGVLILARRVLFRDEYQGWLLPSVLLGLYLLLGVLSLGYAADFATAANNVVDYLKDAIIGIIIILLVQRPRSLRTAIWAMLTAGIFMGSLSVFQQLTGKLSNDFGGFAQVNFSSTTGTRVGGPIGDPNYYAQIIVVLLPLAVDRLWNEKNKILKILAAWAFFVSALTLIFTYSRGGFLAFVTAFLLMGILRPPRLPSVLLGLIALIVISQFIPGTYRDRISSLLNIFPNSRTGGYVDESVQGRTSENRVAWNIFRDNPVLGVGVGNFNTYYQEYSRKLGLDPRLQDRSAHNLYLEIAAERGLLGLMVFGSILILTLRQIFKADALFRKLHNKEMADIATVIGVSFIAYLVTAIFLHDAYPRYFWVFVGIAWAVPQSANYLTRLSQAKAALL